MSNDASRVPGVPPPRGGPPDLLCFQIEQGNTVGVLPSAVSLSETKRVAQRREDAIERPIQLAKIEVKSPKTAMGISAWADNPHYE
jgi:hypothetical protein